MALNTSRFVEPLLPVADLAAQPQTPLRSEEPVLLRFGSACPIGEAAISDSS